MSGLQRRAAIAPPQRDGGGMNHASGDAEIGPIGLGGAVGNAAIQDLMRQGVQGPNALGQGLMEMGKQGAPRPLPFRDRLERSFGTDLSHIETYLGGAAQGALAGLNAAGASADGAILLPSAPSLDQVTHEVAHTLQAPGAGNKAGVSKGSEPAEREADEAVRAVAAGRPAEITESTSASVHRWGLGDLASGAWDAVKSGASTAVDTVKSGASTAWDATKSGVSTAVDATKSGISNAWDATKSGVSNAWDATTNKVSEVYNGTKDWATSTYDSAKTWAGEKVDQAKGWAGEKVGQAKDWAIGKGIDALSWLDDRYHDTYKPGLDWVRNKVDGGSEALKDGVKAGSGWLADGLDWLGWQGGGDGVRDAGKWVNNKVDGVRDTLGLDEDGNSYTHHMDIPENKGGFVQQYSELGLPLTTEAWTLQDKIDGGKLHRVNNTALLNHMVGAGQLSAKDLPEDLASLSSEDLQGLVDRSVLPVLAQSGALKDLVDSGAIKADEIPASFDDMSPKDLKAFADKVRSTGAERDLLDAMSPEDRTSYQEGILNTYMDMANNDPNAAMLLDLMPTETDAPTDKDSILDTLGDAMLKGQEPNDFKVGERTGRIRQGSVMMAEQLREVQGKNTYGLTVPYADTAENILFRNGKPTDAAEHVHNYLSKLNPETTSLLNGYSQGGGAVLEYLREYGNKDGLDYGVSLAPMGGATKDNAGGEGVWGGDFNGVSTLSLMNKNDPAQYIHGKNLSELGPGMLNFISADKDKKLGGQSDIHSGFDVNHPEQGTYGYPMAYGELMVRDLLSNAYTGDYKRRGDWDFDVRKLDPKLDPEEVAARYH